MSPDRWPGATRWADSDSLHSSDRQHFLLCRCSDSNSLGSSFHRMIAKSLKITGPWLFGILQSKRWRSFHFLRQLHLFTIRTIRVSVSEHTNPHALVFCTSSPVCGIGLISRSRWLLLNCPSSMDLTGGKTTGNPSKPIINVLFLSSFSASEIRTQCQFTHFARSRWHTFHSHH